MQVLLHRFEPQENTDRWYLVTVQQTLLDPVAVVCQYGRRHTTWQQTRVLPTDSADEARLLAKKIVMAKLKRGYKLKLSHSSEPHLVSSGNDFQTRP